MSKPWRAPRLGAAPDLSQSSGMKSSLRRLWAVACVGLALGGPVESLVSAEGYSLGMAEREITPDPALRNWVSQKPYDGVLDRVFTRAFYVGDGAQELLIITWDLVDAREAAVAETRARLSDRTGIPPAHIAVNASHTHSAPWSPLMGQTLPAHERGNLAPVEESPGFKEWSKRLIDQTVAAAAAAKDSAKPGTLGLGRASVAELIFNRRPMNAAGRVETTFTPPTPHALPPGLRFSPMDPTVTVLQCETSDGPGSMALFHMPCHSVAVYPHSQAISADWPGAAIHSLKQAQGMRAMFLQGCAGDIVPMRRGLGQTIAMGDGVAQRVALASANAKKLSAPPLWAETRAVDLPLNDRAAKEMGAKTMTTEVQVLLVGGVALVTLPGEPLIGLAMAIQAASPFPDTLVLGYSNGYGVGYVGMPGDQAKGGYEMTHVNGGTDECGALLVGAAEALLKKAKAFAAQGSAKPR